MSDVKLLKKIGQGAFGTVYLGDKNGEQCAVKVIPVTDVHPRIVQDAIKEGKLLEKLQHPNIIKYVGCHSVQSKHGSEIHLVMEYCGGGDLHNSIKKKKSAGCHFPESQIMSWFLGVNKAVQYLHSKGIIHRDIKPMNILKHDDGTIKLGDFGLAKILHSKLDFKASVMGTVIYASPELHLKTLCDYRGDMWSLGCTLYELAKLEPAFRSPGELINYTKIRSVLRPLPKEYTDVLRNMISSLLQVDPNKRPTAADVIKSLQSQRPVDKSKVEPIQAAAAVVKMQNPSTPNPAGRHGNQRDKSPHLGVVRGNHLGKLACRPLLCANGVNPLLPGFNMMMMGGLPLPTFQILGQEFGNGQPGCAARRRDGKSPDAQFRVNHK